MSSIERKKAKPRLVQLLDETKYFKCTVCDIGKIQRGYRFRHQQYVPKYVPPILEPVCRKCVYRECFGSKNYKKEMKERSLDGEI